MAVIANAPQQKRFLDQPMANYLIVLVPTVALCIIGLLMVQSSSSAYAGSKHNQPYVFFQRQIIFLLGGALGCYIISRIPVKYLKRLAWVAWAGSMGLLIAGAIYGIGSRGQTNWLPIFGNLAIQPSEFAKFGLVVWSAGLFADKIRLLDQVKHLLWPFIPFSGVIVALVLVGKDLGTAIVLVLIIAAMLWFVGAPGRVLMLMSAIAAPLILVLTMTNANRLTRIYAWLNPSEYPTVAAQQLSSIYGLSSGGWWGLGLGAGRQKWGGLKDGSHTDFIFSVIGEELGLFGALVVLGLFAMLIWGAIRIAIASDQPFTRMLASGIGAWIFVQAGTNILVCIGLLPVLGIPLPFISYGGSALVSTLAGVGCLLACAKAEPKAREYRAARASAGKVTRMPAVSLGGARR